MKKQMKKQLSASIVCLCLLLLMFVGSSLAWFTDTHYTYDVMTTANVTLKQTSDSIPTGEMLFPNVHYTRNIVVKNTGNTACYLRYFIAFEDGVYNTTSKVVDMIKPYSEYTDNSINTPITLNNGISFVVKIMEGANVVSSTTYTVYTFTLTDPFTSGADQVILNSFDISKDANSDWRDAVGNEYDIIALSQATQVTGMESFGSAEGALNEAFGVVNGDNIVKWFDALIRAKITPAAGQTIEIEVVP